MSDSKVGPEAPSPSVGRGVAPGENAVAMLAPAPLVNRMILSRNAFGVRVAFLEEGVEGQGPLVRSAVFLGADDAITLGRLLLEIYADVVRRGTQ